MAEGWIKLYRQLQQCDLWNEKPFSRGQAWVDMLLTANHETRNILFDGRFIPVERGSFITSEVKLMDRWGWSKSKVRLFLNQLEKQQMIIKNTDRKKTSISICNYSTYQDSETTEKPLKNHRKTTERPLKDTNKNVKNDKNDKKDIYSDYTENPNLLKALKDFEIMRNSMKNGKFTDQAKKLLLTKLNKLADTDEKKIAILEQSIFYGWKGVFPLKQGQAQKNGFDNFKKRTYDTVSLKEKLLKKGRGEI